MGSPRIVIASEMGGGWGHLLPLGLIAREFAGRGANVVVLAREVEKARSVFSALGIHVVPSPALSIEKSGFSLNYAQCVLGNGYLDRGRFEAGFAWWRERFSEILPRFVLADFAPTALLAAKADGLPRGAIGTGFTLPPPVVPMPGLHPWLQLDPARLAAAEDVLVGTVRGAVPGIDSVASFFDGARRFLTVFPELDHFETRPAEKYMGAIVHGVGNSPCDWPSGGRPRVFVYLGAGNRSLEPLFGHLRRIGISVVGHVRGLPDTDRRALEGPTIRMIDSLVDLDEVVADCDVAVTQGGLHTTARMLLAGVPVLVCPEQLEQALLAWQLKRRGLAAFVSLWSDPSVVRERFDTVASSESLRANVAAFAARYAGYRSSDTVETIVAECLEAAG